MDDQKLFIVKESAEVLLKSTGKRLLALKIRPQHWELQLPGRTIRARSKSRIIEIAKGSLSRGADPVDPSRSIYEDRGFRWLHA